jgi:hypothetical protein
MRRRRLWIVLLILGATLLALALRHAHIVNVQKLEERRRRDAHNQAELLKYAQAFNPGLTRKEVKDYLQAQGVNFFERTGYENGFGFAVLVKVGEEDVPWFCSEWPDYVAFEFVVTEPYKLPFPVDSDLLNNLRQYKLELLPADWDALGKVHLVSNGEGCL